MTQDNRNPESVLISEFWSTIFVKYSVEKS